MDLGYLIARTTLGTSGWLSMSGGSPSQRRARAAQSRLSKLVLDFWERGMASSKHRDQLYRDLINALNALSDQATSSAIRSLCAVSKLDVVYRFEYYDNEQVVQTQLFSYADMPFGSCDIDAFRLITRIRKLPAAQQFALANHLSLADWLSTAKMFLETRYRYGSPSEVVRVEGEVQDLSSRLQISSDSLSEEAIYLSKQAIDSISASYWDRCPLPIAVGIDTKASDLKKAGQWMNCLGSELYRPLPIDVGSTSEEASAAATA